MVLRFHFNSILSRLAFAAGVILVAGSMAFVIVVRYAIGTLTDYRIAVDRSTLLVPAWYFPGSPRLNARLADAELFESDRDLQLAEHHAKAAVELSPYDFHNYLTLALVKEAEGDRFAAQQQLELARSLAPHDASVRWRLANVLLRQGKLAEALPEFRLGLASNVLYLRGALDLVWRASRGNVEAVKSITSEDSRAQLTLAEFLVRQSRFSDAASVFALVDRADRMAAPESTAVVNSLITAGRYDVARQLWRSMVRENEKDAVIWNGGFDSDVQKNFAQFDWAFARSEYARPSIDSGVSHGGTRSLKVEFLGRDTTTLDGEVKQMVLVSPGVRYRIECWVKTASFVTPEGPKLVAADVTTGAWLGSSEPISEGTSDWHRIQLEFIAPQANAAGACAVYVSLKRKPRFSYDDPTKGTIWLDDFSMSEAR
ncbi:MAG TPA: hypothetical protein VKM94_00440 [Blastocatellia bacterium]|nr:hypothetical protein [Blastocatellia bacterium]